MPRGSQQVDTEVRVVSQVDIVRTQAALIPSNDDSADTRLVREGLLARVLKERRHNRSSSDEGCIERKRKKKKKKK